MLILDRGPQRISFIFFRTLSVHYCLYLLLLRVIHSVSVLLWNQCQFSLSISILFDPVSNALMKTYMIMTHLDLQNFESSNFTGLITFNSFTLYLYQKDPIDKSLTLVLVFFFYLPSMCPLVVFQFLMCMYRRLPQNLACL